MPADWTHRMLIACPLDLLDQAAAIGRALDPDVGGAQSFAGVRAGPDSTTQTHAVCDVIVVTEFAGQAQAMLADPALLHAACAADYAMRWADLTPPSLADCEQFVSGSVIVIEPRGRELADVLAGAGLVLVPPPENP